MIYNNARGKNGHDDVGDGVYSNDDDNDGDCYYCNHDLNSKPTLQLAK